MGAHRVFLLAASQLTVYHWRGGRLDTPYTFPSEEQGLSRFSEYLDATPNDPSYLLVDVVEEEFREETIPHVYAADRRALVSTKANRLFRDARYTQAVFQGREPDGRRDDRVLFTALIRPDLLAPWLGQLARHKVPLAGIYSLPVLSERLLKHIPDTGDHMLLVSLQGAGGLRQTFFKQGQVKLSRLAVMPNLEPAQYASFILAEVEKIRRYLNSLRLVSRESPLDVFVLSHGDMLEDLDRQAMDTVVTRHHFVDIGTVARASGLKDRVDSAISDPLFAHLLARYTPADHYANAEDRRYHALHRARTTLKAAALLIALVSLGWSGLSFVESVIAGEQASMLAHQTVFYQQRYDRARQKLPRTPVAPGELKLAVEGAGTLRDRRARTEVVLAVVGRALAASPELKLDELRWVVSDDPENSVGNVARGRAGSPGITPDAQAGPYQVALIEGRVEPFEGDYRAAIDSVNRLADHLAAVPVVSEVEVIRLPLDLSSEKALSGEAGSVQGGADFSVRVVVGRLPGNGGRDA